jgi:hypothetical protein
MPVNALAASFELHGLQSTSFLFLCSSLDIILIIHYTTGVNLIFRLQRRLDLIRV